MEKLYLIVGLGNPGAEYARTRHNVGFVVAERLAERWQAGWTYERKFNARLAAAQRDGPACSAVRAADVHELERRSCRRGDGVLSGPAYGLLVVVDDADLPLGEIRLRPEGGSGGHHGLESVEQHLGTRAYARLRIGMAGRRGSRDYGLCAGPI